MKGVAGVLIIIILVLSVGVVLLLPQGKASDTGLVVLTQNKETIGNFFSEGRLKQQYISRINGNIKNVPEHLFELFGNNKINVYVEFDDGTVHDYWVHTEENRVVDFRQGARSIADVELHLKESTLDKILTSKEPLGVFLDAMNSGEIKYEGKTIEGGVKSAAVGVTTRILGFVNSGFKFFTGFFR